MAEVLQEPICNATWVATGDDKEKRCFAPRHPPVAEDAMNKKRICCPSRCSSRLRHEMYRCIYTNRICAHGARYEEGDAAPTEFMSTSCVDASGSARCAHVTNRVSIHCFFTPPFFSPSALLLRPCGFVWATNHRTVPPDDVRFVTLWVVVHL